MRLSHFEALRPICPICKSRNVEDEFPLAIASVSSESQSQIVEGILHCSNRNCQSEFPILDGVPILLPNLRSYIADNLFHLVVRNDLSPITESILGDCCSQGSVLDSMKQHLSCYVWGHYADLDPNEKPDPAQRHSVVQILEQAIELESTDCDQKETVRANTGPTIDIGCGPGRTTIEIAEKKNCLTLGVDLNFSMLRVASNILRQKRVVYPRRRVGLVYDRREFDIAFSSLERVDFWACDGLALPFSDAVFARAVGLNVLDSVGSPSSLLRSIARVLQPKGDALLACPYDWTVNVTPVEAWIGGHSQRNQDAGECAAWLRRLLTDGNVTAISGEPSLHLVNELDDVPWTVRLHDRSSMHYRVHLVHAQSRIT